MDCFITSKLDLSLGDETAKFESEALAYYEDATAGLEEAAELEAEIEDAAIDGESDISELQCFQQHNTAPSRSRARNISVQLPPSTLQCPRSIYEDGFSLSISKERVAVQSLLEADPTQADDDFIEFELDNFSCYVNSDRFPFEMRALHTHATLTGKTVFYFDGVLKVGDVRHLLRQVPFEQIPLGNYGKNHPTVGDQLWIRSKFNEKQEIYYRLKSPSREYARFHKAFLWVADLAKHVVDFAEYMIDQHDRNVSLHHFKGDFGQWLRQTHGKEPEFKKWYKQRGCDDFRQSIVANQAFLRKETFGTLDKVKWCRLDIFHEIAKPFDFYKRQVREAEHWPVRRGPPDTIVTPYIHECFSGMRLGQLLKAVQPCISTEERIKLSWPDKSTAASIRRVGKFVDHNAMIESIKPGDMISTHHDPDDCNKWKAARPKGNPGKEAPEEETQRWYCLVQKVYTRKDGSRRFDILWMYQPEDTPCCSMRYPYKNELFLSDHCTCHTGEARIKDTEVTGIHAVEWFGSPGTTHAEFFVRQTYQHVLRRFVTLEQAHLRCRIGEKLPHENRVGDTVLVLTPGTNVLEPYELLGYLEGERTVRLRRLPRRRQIDGQQHDCAPNELVYTEEEAFASVNEIHSKCIIRCYSPGEEIPVPYNRNGTGNAFIITHRKLSDGTIQPLGSEKPQLRQGFDPKRRVNKLRALDLYCGCGNLGRGLEDGGAVEAKWANDIWDAAMHTYMANVKDPQSVTPFLGSVDDLLHYGLEGKFSDAVPRPGDVDLISGGSPCPGFSLITKDKTTIEQKKNRSLVASFAAYADFYRPKYGVLENVTNIVQAQGSEEDFLSQLFCAIVGMGYQAQIMLGDAWAHGAPQRRERAFLWFAAPGLRLPFAPEPSHSHPPKMTLKGLGKITNGESFMRRTDPPTPFKYVTPHEATADLPDIYDAKPDTCVPFPDHRLSISISSGDMKVKADTGDGKSIRTQILNIPTRPYGMSFAKAWYGRTGAGADTPRDMFPHERDAFPMRPSSFRVSRISKGWERVHPRGLFGTVTTFCHVTDARVGNWTHWDQPRPVTIMEVRRAQGVPDEEVLLGTPKDQWRLLGNAVSRQMATALGLVLREAWMGTLYEGGGEAPVLQLHQEAEMAEGEDVVVDGDGGGDYSSRSPTPGLRFMYSDNEAAPARAGGRVFSTPATSLPDANNDDPVMAANGGVTNGGKKRSVSKALVDDLVTRIKKPRLTPYVLDEEPKQLDDGDDGDDGDGDEVLYLGSAPLGHQPLFNGSTVVSFNDDHMPDGDQALRFTGGDDIPMHGSAPVASPPRPNGPTVVRLLSDDEEDDY
ncbi:DNA (cytosine-5)-methyltransferase 1 [Cytospora mali]|uniref:DNA (cytosine-5-)-methyltransferase n=1 Tax=Cytospora mali TaxID=578113 RepID=A0A194W8A7_CYTMA|nr:DNA (cytosine-5)-methyltransferase 1 [Valsa mali]